MKKADDNSNGKSSSAAGMIEGADKAMIADESFNIDDFDVTGIDFPAALESPQRLIDRLCNADGAHHNEPENGEQGMLFAHVVGRDEKSDGPVGEKTDNALWDTVIRAYGDVRCDRSSDYVVADPAADLRYLQRCMELGAPARPFELNWMLMNARKAGKLADFPRAKAFSIPKEKLDLFAFAADIAMRMVQERVYFSQQRSVSIDHVLCDPGLVGEFDRIASGLVPGFNATEYRWAVITLRKARRFARDGFELPSFDSFGLLEDVRLSQLPDTWGTYWIQAGESSILTGVATNTRCQVGSLLERMGFGVIPEEMRERPKEKMRLAVSVNGNYQTCEFARAALHKQSGSRLNFWYGDFFGGAAA